MSHHSKEFENILDKARELGCRVEGAGNTIRVFPADKTKQGYICHAGPKAAHPLRRFLQNTFNVKISLN